MPAHGLPNATPRQYAPNMSDIRRALGMAIKVARIRRGWSQQRLAEAAGMHRTNLSEIEGGRRDVALSTQERIAKALEMTLGDLMVAAEREQERDRRPKEGSDT